MNAKGQKFTYADEYAWLASRRATACSVCSASAGQPALRLDVFAYDLNEPDLCTILITLAKQGGSASSSTLPRSITTRRRSRKCRRRSVRGALHGGGRRPARSRAASSRASRTTRSHRLERRGAMKVLTGSTNFPSPALRQLEHVLVFDDAGVAALYGQVFEKVWSDHVKADPFPDLESRDRAASFAPPDLPDMDINFSPHDKRARKR